jgi:hypothetical protein
VEAERAHVLQEEDQVGLAASMWAGSSSCEQRCRQERHRSAINCLAHTAVCAGAALELIIILQVCLQRARL